MEERKWVWASEMEVGCEGGGEDGREGLESLILVIREEREEGAEEGSLMTRSRRVSRIEEIS